MFAGPNPTSAPLSLPVKGKHLKDGEWLDRDGNVRDKYGDLVKDKSGNDLKSCKARVPWKNDGAKPLSEWLKDDPDLLEEARRLFKEEPEWQGIDPDHTLVFYRATDEVEEIRSKPGESGGHHPHGLALGGPEGQILTPTEETRTEKNPKHTAATRLQRRIINIVKER